MELPSSLHMMASPPLHGIIHHLAGEYLNIIEGAVGHGAVLVYHGLQLTCAQLPDEYSAIVWRR